MNFTSTFPMKLFLFQNMSFESFFGVFDPLTGANIPPNTLKLAEKLHLLTFGSYLRIKTLNEVSRPPGTSYFNKKFRHFLNQIYPLKITSEKEAISFNLN